jgi:hypothetical protein
MYLLETAKEEQTREMIMRKTSEIKAKGKVTFAPAKMMSPEVNPTVLEFALPDMNNKNDLVASTYLEASAPVERR